MKSAAVKYQVVSAESGEILKQFNNFEELREYCLDYSKEYDKYANYCITDFFSLNQYISDIAYEKYKNIKIDVKFNIDDDLLAILQAGRIETQEQADVFKKYADLIIEDGYTDSRIEFDDCDFCFVETYADVDEDAEDVEEYTIVQQQDIRYYSTELGEIPNPFKCDK